MAYALHPPFTEVTGFDPCADPELQEHLRQAVLHDLRADRLRPSERQAEFQLKYEQLCQAITGFRANFLTLSERNAIRIVSRIGYPNPVQGRPRTAMHVPKRAVCAGSKLPDFGQVLAALEVFESPRISIIRPWPEDAGPHPKQGRPRMATHQVRTRAPALASAR